MQLVEVPKSPFVCRNLVGGEWQKPTDVEWRDIVSPYTGQVVGKVPLCGAKEVAAIVAKAEPASRKWRNTPLKERSQYLFRFRELLLANIDRLSKHREPGRKGSVVDLGVSAFFDHTTWIP